MLTVQQYKQNISFKSGLTPAIKRDFALRSPQGIEQAFRSAGVDAKFDNNRAIACCCAKVSDIFDALSNAFNLPFRAKPPSIRLFNEDNLINKNNSRALGFCIVDSSYVLENEPMFEVRSLFLNDKFRTLTDIDENAERNFSDRWNSTSHFLHTYIHEWVHNIHDDILFRAFGYDGRCPRATARYNSYYGLYHDPNPRINGVNYLNGPMFNKSYTEDEKEIIRKEISQYAAGRRNFNGTKNGGNPFEVVAEYITKKVINVLDPYMLMPTKNPFADNTDSKEVIDIFSKAWSGIL